MATPAEKKLRRARTMLILGDGDEPFFGSVAIGLDLIEDKRCRTAATDGKTIIYNADWIESLDIEETMALFEHEVFHVALKHGRLMRDVIKEPNFDMALWQQACDYPINELLQRKGRKLPLGPNGEPPVLDSKYDGWSAMRIYRQLLEDKEAMLDCDGDATDGSGQDNDQKGGDAQGQQQNGAPSDDGDQEQKNKRDELIEETGNFGGIMPLLDDVGEVASDEEVKKVERNFEMTVMNSARVLEKSLESQIGDIPGFVQEIIEAHTKPQRTYKDELIDIMEEITRDDYNWGKPNRKYEDVYLPSLYDKKLAELVVIVDSSGSVTQKELEIYAGEISGILEEFEGIQVHVLFHHVSVYNIETYESSDLPVKFGNIRSGGTSYRDAYRKIETEGYDPKAVLHFTDLDVMKSDFPQEKPEYPVFWMNTTPRLVNGRLRHATPPWGQVIDLDINA